VRRAIWWQHFTRKAGLSEPRNPDHKSASALSGYGREDSLAPRHSGFIWFLMLTGYTQVFGQMLYFMQQPYRLRRVQSQPARMTTMTVNSLFGGGASLRGCGWSFRISVRTNQHNRSKASGPPSDSVFGLPSHSETTATQDHSPARAYYRKFAALEILQNLGEMVRGIVVFRPSVLDFRERAPDTNSMRD